MSEYITTTSEVETCYHEYAVHLVGIGDTSFPPEFADWKVGQAAFQQWLAEHERKLSEQVWDEAERRGRDNERELFRLMALNRTSEGAKLVENPYRQGENNE